ncbi:MAG: hypothetical protein GF344_04260 [Chitinivibrionales bacterium]|nr:hypothetical protein [Chitinivibrionales bacterium]MBD3356258.1 hypothetical protein [Chitinivibrionales bacterium]
MRSASRIDYYARREKHLQHLFGKCSAKLTTLSNARLASVLVAAAAAAYLFLNDNPWIATAAIIGGLILFAVFVARYGRVKGMCTVIRRIIEINGVSRLSIEEKRAKIADRGEEFIDNDHHYAVDLDIFGKGSLFQLINCATTYFGRERLAEILSQKRFDHRTIVHVQNALRELAGSVGFRQKLQAYARESKDIGRPPFDFIRWCREHNEKLGSPALVPAIRTLPFVTVASLLSLALHPIAFPVFFLLLLAQFTLIAIHMRKIHAVYTTLSGIVERLKSYRDIMRLLEKRVYKTEKLQALHRTLLDPSSKAASSHIGRLDKILVNLQVRQSPLIHWLLNLLFLWDLQWFIALINWKRRYGRCVEPWLRSVGEFETLASLARIDFDNPDWTYPVVTGEGHLFEGEELGHPLIEERDRICNSFSMVEPGTTAIITGSNMSGKSTFLRTVGINLVLAYAGAPICAASLKCSRMDIYSSMRIRDNLLGKVSTFYAELLRIRDMVTHVKTGEPLLYLIDELFRGTNSRDRHEGAVAVLNTLRGEGGMGLISTHDLQLCNLAKQYPEKFRNFHFEEQYVDNSITFDYKLRHGPSTTTNAIKMIQMVGIDVEGYRHAQEK